MSCICQYVRISSVPNLTDIRVSFGVTASATSETAPEAPVERSSVPAGPTFPAYSTLPAAEASKEPVSDDAKIAVCVSDLAKFRAENWLLKKKLHDYEATIQNLEQLTSSIVTKQQQVTREMFELRRRNNELEMETNMLREYHVIERNALIQEVQELKTLSNNHFFLKHCEENISRTTDSQEQLSYSGSDDDCRPNHDSDAESVSALSSIGSTGCIPITNYSSDSQSEGMEYSDEEQYRQCQHEQYSTATETESD